MGATTSELTPLLVEQASAKASSTEQPGNGNASKSVNFHDDKDVDPSWSEVMQKLTPYFRPVDRWHMFCAIGAFITVATGKILGILPPLAIKYAVDAISSIDLSDETSTNDSTHRVLKAIGAYAVLKVLILVNGALQDLAQRNVALDAERRFAVTTFSHLHHLSLGYHLEKHIGEITRIMNRGSDAMSTVISSFLFYLAPTFFEAIVVSAVFWKLGTPMVALSTIGAVVVYLTFTVLVTKTRIEFRRKLIAASDAVGQKETETLVNYETVAMFGRTNREIALYGDLRQDYKDKRVEMIGLFTLLQFGQSFIKLLGTSTGLVIAGMAAVYGYGPNNEKFLSPGSFVAVQIFIEQLFQPLTQLGWQYRMITQAFTDLEKCVTMLNRTPDVQDFPNAMKWNKPCPREPGKYGEIRFENVSFHYKVKSQKRDLGTALNGSSKRGVGRHGLRRGREAMGFVDEDAEKASRTEDDNDPIKLGGVSNISIQVPAGRTAALVGASGSGKTTLIRLLLRMYDPDEGSVFVDGHNVKDLTQESLRSNVGVVAQDTILFNASLRDNITYGKEDATDEEVWAAVKASALEKFVLGLPDKLDTLVGERGMKLSGGERQRVGLARCIIKDPELVLLDEATSALDSTTEVEIQRNIASICKDRTTLMIAHRLSTARRADRIIVLDAGSVVETGTHDVLISKGGVYAKMWKLQTESHSDN
eukprot:Nitzschia sp. Nitz4//scaffold42_size132992//43605//45716//NITZ4_003390-RA/size132992-processed-gene-0.28-mRNA-1//-1//CDS//3329551691//3161//frame0